MIGISSLFHFLNVNLNGSDIMRAYNCSIKQYHLRKAHDETLMKGNGGDYDVHVTVVVNVKHLYPLRQNNSIEPLHINIHHYFPSL